VVLLPALAHAVGPTVAFTLPALHATPSAFGSLPFPCDLYFDGGTPGGGDGTLLDAGASIGLGVDVARANTAAIEDALDLLDGFGTTSAVYFFLSGPLDAASLPASPVLAPALTDAAFCAEAATAAPVPIALKFDVDTRIPNVLGVLPLPGRPLNRRPPIPVSCAAPSPAGESRWRRRRTGSPCATARAPAPTRTRSSTPWWRRSRRTASPQRTSPA